MERLQKLQLADLAEECELHRCKKYLKKQQITYHTMLELKNIIREYQVGDETIRVLKGIDLIINDGEFVAIM